MTFSIIHILLAIFGLGFLVFIHELGHYWMARRKGMKIEVFAIGFGRPLYKWERQGVQWQIGWLPFGGYVKIAGMQKEGNREPFEIPDGFYGKTPWQRVQVAIAGPFVNIAFAFVAFSLLWITGGREKPFAQFTHRIGLIDTHSQLYQKGVRPGDEILAYNNKPFEGFRDVQVTSLMKQKEISIEGEKIDEMTGQKTPFQYLLTAYDDPRFSKDKLLTIGIFSPASYLLYAGLPLGESPLVKSGLKEKDRLLWVNGEFLFSSSQLSNVVNEQTAFLTIKRGQDTFQTKVPRVFIADLQMSSSERGEIDDWQHEAEMKGKLSELYFIPYNLSPSCKVESRLGFIDEKESLRAFEACQRCGLFTPLEEGDQILAVDGQLISSPYQLLAELQNRRLLVIVERDPLFEKPVSWKKADLEFDAFNRPSIEAMISSIGTDAPIHTVGNLHLLNPLTPRLASDFASAKELALAKKSIEAIKDPKIRQIASKEFEESQKRLVLGLRLQDRQVQYNPNPFVQFKEVLQDISRTFSALFRGTLSPKYLSGPVGIVHMVQQSWSSGAKDALYWLGVISLNLGFLNLLPIPVLDGGHILFSLWEGITKKRIKPKTMERLIFPFVGLLIAFFLFATYQDILRLFQ